MSGTLGGGELVFAQDLTVLKPRCLQGCDLTGGSGTFSAHFLEVSDFRISAPGSHPHSLPEALSARGGLARGGLLLEDWQKSFSTASCP